jgi:transposase-like protein
MYSKEQRRIAIETFIRFDHSYADTIAELGYPDRHSLRNWWREYRETGEVPVPKREREPKYPLEMRTARSSVHDSAYCRCTVPRCGGAAPMS